MIDIKTIIPEAIKEFLKDEQYRKYIVLGVLGVIVLVYLVFGIMPKFSERAKLSREVKELKNNVELVNTRMAMLDQMTAKLKSLRMEFAGYADGLPNEKDVPAFLQELSTVARKSNVKILSITPSEFRPVAVEGKDNKFYREMPISVTAKSGYHELGEFISNIEQAKRFITVENLEISYDSRFPQRHNIDLVFKTYVSIDEEKK